MSSTGTTIDRSQDLAAGGATTVTGWGPPRKAATRSGGRTVADRPTRWIGPPPVSATSASSRSRVKARCAPRLVPATAWTSSTITVATLRSVSRAAEVKIKNSDSGVVIKMSGGWVTSLRRSAAEVSPERTPTVTLGGACPSRSAVRVIPASGARRLRSTSTARALSGDTYKTRQRCLTGGRSALVSPSSAHKKAASVLPEPVGAMTSAFWPAEIAFQAPAWAAVGLAKTSRNHVAVAGVNWASGSAA